MLLILHFFIVHFYVTVRASLPSGLFAPPGGFKDLNGVRASLLKENTQCRTFSLQVVPRFSQLEDIIMLLAFSNNSYASN